MAQLREARTPSEVKTDAVISAMKSRDFRQRLHRFWQIPILILMERVVGPV